MVERDDKSSQLTAKGIFMYEEANTAITKGLSVGPRIILGLVSALFGAGMVILGADSEHPIGVIGFGMFCLLISTACIAKGRVRQFVGSVIGSAIFILGLAYLLDELMGGSLIFGSRSKPSVLNAILFLVFIGMPGATYALKARFGLRRQP